MRSLQIALLVVAASLAGCLLDVVDNHYATLADARDERLFEKGGLPDILPPSAHAIRTANNLDSGTSRGHFEFSDTDAADFFKAVELGAPAEAPVEDWTALVRDQERAGRIAWRYRERFYTWVFFCHPSRDECDYVMW